MGALTIVIYSKTTSTLCNNTQSFRQEFKRF